MRHTVFYVYDAGTGSSTKPQMSGVSQGCTLSPFLFIILMTILTHDAKHNLKDDAVLASERGELADLTYADDTVLIGVSEHQLRRFLVHVADAGARYGPELH